MKKLYSLFILLSLSNFAFTQSGPPWTGSNFGYNYIFTAIDFPSGQSSIGFACGESLTYQGDGIVLKTTDGGTTWNQVWTGAGRGVEGAAFTDVNTGYIAGWPKLAQGWSGVGKTTDGGATWTSLTVTNNIYFYTDIVFKDANNGIVVGQTNTGAGVWVTSNGGTTWTPGTGFVAIPQQACYISGNTYYLVDNSGNIQKSTNNGLTWSTVWNAGGSVYLLGIDHYGDNTIMACGDYGLVVVSQDGGITWNAQTVGVDIWHDFGFDSPDHAVLCGTPGLVFETWDGGVAWQNANPQGAGGGGLYECIFTADFHGFICGSQGVELKRNPSCGADFEASATSACTGRTVSFTDLSWGNITSYSWEFEGGTPSVSSDPEPVVVYASPGTYDVKLTVSNPWWTDTKTENNYITVSQTPPTPVIVENNFILTSDASAGNQWYLNGNAIPGATDQTWEATASGTYWDVVTTGACSSDTSNNINITMTGVEEETGKWLVISPVPNAGKFNISYSGTAEIHAIKIYDVLGKCIYFSETISNLSPMSIDLGNVTSGVYLVVVTDVNGVRSKREILVRR